MRKFILGLIVGGLAVYLWQKRNTGSEPTALRAPQTNPPIPTAPEPELGKPKDSESSVKDFDVHPQPISPISPT